MEEKTNKILIITNSDSGLYNVRKELLEKLAVDNQIFIACPAGNKIDFFESCGYTIINVDVDRRGMNPLRDICFYKQCKKVIKTVKPDKVITYSIKPNIYGSYACKKTKVPYYVNITGLGSSFQNSGLVKKLVILMYKIALKKTSKVFFENEGNREVFLQNKIVKEDKTVLLAGAGVNINQYKYRPLEKKDNIAFVFVGRIMREKGIIELFEAITKIKSNEIFKNITFDFFGGFEEDYKLKINEMEKQGLIRYNGYAENLNEIYPNYDCLILPSYHEGMANVLLEAASCGLPLITTNIHGCKEAVIEDKSGYLVQKANSNDLYDKIVKFINLSYENRLEMGRVGRNLMEEKFDKQKVVEATIKEITL